MHSPVSPSDLAAKLGPTLHALDAQRLVYAHKAQNGMFIGLGIMVVGVLTVLALGLSALWLLAPLLIGGGIWAGVSSSATSAYSSEFKMLVMPTLVSQFGALRYTPKPGLSEHDFNTARLFNQPDRFSSEDLIEGIVGSTQLRMSEVHAEERYTTTDSKGHTQTHYRDIFKGMMFIFDFNKNFVGQTYVTPEDLTGSLGGLGKMFQRMGAKISGRGEVVQLEDPEFERLFKVSATDQTEARYILSSSLMRRFVDLHNRQQNVVAAAFVFGQMFLLLAKNDNWFEAPSLQTPLDLDALSSTLQQLSLATNLVHDLDVNTRIWSKE